MQERSPSSTGGTRGRPRSPATQSRILEATLRRLAEDGYSRMTIDAIAADAGVSKPSMYRRWASKADIATAALRTIQLSEPPVNTGSLRGDLTGTLKNFSRSLLRPNGMSLIGTVLGEESHTPELLQLFRERIVVPRRAMLRSILERAQKQKELRAGVDLDTVVNMLVGAFYARYLAATKMPANFAEDLVDVVWIGIAAKR